MSKPDQGLSLAIISRSTGDAQGAVHLPFIHPWQELGNLNVKGKVTSFHD
jgi:hypothetical protein